MFDLSQLGARVDDIAKTVTFSIYLPSISSPTFSVNVRCISKANQFDKDIPATPIPLKPSPGTDTWGDLPQSLWISDPISLPNGIYFYRYEIIGPAKDGSGTVRSLFFGDPFAKETANGIFSVFTIGKAPFIWNEPPFTVPSIKDAIIYELNVAEFNYTFDGIVDRLPYLKSLGINVIELLPITSVADPSQWGYMPIFYFSPEERYGGPDALKRMVEECHKVGIAVILDMVYAHTDGLFAYQVGYDRFFHLWNDNKYKDASGKTVRSPNPMVSKYSNYGRKSDFRISPTLEFYKAVNQFWIEEYHIDGFRYDHVNGFLDTQPVFNDDGTPNWDKYRPRFKSLQDLTKDTYAFSNDPKFPRFTSPNGTSRLIQIAEDLGQAHYQLAQISDSAITGGWEESLFYASTDMAIHNCLNGSYVNELLLSGPRWDNFTGTKTIDGKDEIPVSPIVYNNCHDKSHLMYRIAKRQEWDPTGFDYPTGISNLAWYKLQPYAIALLTGVGTPMLWEGEEFAEAYGLPESGQSRVRGTRSLHWDYFYSPNELPRSPTVLPLTTLYRNLCELRLKYDALRGPRTRAKKEFEDFNTQTVVYRRWSESPNQAFVIAINFSEKNIRLNVPFGHAGTWVDVLDQYYNPASPYTKNATSNSDRVPVDINSNFGRIFMLN